MIVDTSAALASLGIAGLTIGFAARDALSNLISGILIFIDRPFVVGDLVEIEDHYGKVSAITLRSTRIITSDGKMLAVPNAEIINQKYDLPCGPCWGSGRAWRSWARRPPPGRHWPWPGPPGLT